MEAMKIKPDAVRALGLPVMIADVDSTIESVHIKVGASILHSFRCAVMPGITDTLEGA